MIDKKYNIIYADPPWSYNDKLLGKSGACNKYDVMNLQDICNLNVSQIAADNCILFMWVTMPHLEDAFKVISSWGFTYKTCAFTWIKQNKKSDSLFWGLGRWTRSNPELCLLAIKGKPKAISHSVHSVILSKLEEHSKKPDETRDRIIQLCGDLPRIELFARQKTEGWDVFGNEVESDIQL